MLGKPDLFGPSVDGFQTGQNVCDRAEYGYMRETKSRTASPGTPDDQSEISPAVYRQHSGEISIVMGNFFLRYLGQIYREFKGDLAAVIVLGEIGHHNINHCYSGQGAGCQVHQEQVNDSKLWQSMHPCNAFSLSAATGIPRETVRRKIEELVSRGWLRRNPKGGVFLTKAVVQHFYSGFNPRLLRELLDVAQRLQQLIGNSPQPVRLSKKSLTSRSE